MTAVQDKVHNNLPPGWKKIVGPDGHTFKTLPQRFSQNDKRNRTHNEGETPKGSDKESAGKKNEIMSYKEVARNRKHLSKRFPRESLLKKTLMKLTLKVPSMIIFFDDDHDEDDEL